MLNDKSCRKYTTGIAIDNFNLPRPVTMLDRVYRQVR